MRKLIFFLHSACTMEHLSYDLLDQIFILLDGKSLACLAFTNKLLLHSIWKHLAVAVNRLGRIYSIRRSINMDPDNHRGKLTAETYEHKVWYIPALCICGYCKYRMGQCYCARIFT